MEEGCHVGMNVQEVVVGYRVRVKLCLGDVEDMVVSVDRVDLLAV